MKKRLFIIAVLAIGMAACLGSCKKKTTEPTTDPTPTVTLDSTLLEMPACKHDSIIHVMAVEPTAEENGCIEHYACARCGKTFADAQGTTPVDNTILWATNYTIDTDCIIENQLAEYAGDENYLWQFLRECLKNYDGSIYDFTGWEDWTEDEWNAFWEYLDQLIQGWGGKSQLNTKQVADDGGDILSLVGDVAGLFLTGLINSEVANSNNIDASVMEFFDENFLLNKSIEKIMNQLNDIQDAINDLSNKFNQQVYKDALQRRSDRLTPLYLTTHPYFREIINKISGKGLTYSRLMDSIPSIREEITNLSKQWMDTYVNGNRVYTEFLFMLQDYHNNFNTQKTMPEIYDMVVYFSTPWEHEGYVYREMARDVDALVMAECYVMELIYYNTHPNEQWLDKPEFNTLLGQYVETLNNYKVVRHDDRLVCQINGAQASIKKDMKKLEAYPYLVEHSSEIDVKGTISMSKFRKHLLPTGSVSQDWYRVVYQYYERIATANGQTIGDNFLYEKLSEIGFNNVPVTIQHPLGFIVADCTCEWHDPDFTAIGEYENSLFRIYIQAAGYNTDWIGYHTCVGRKDGCTGKGVTIWHMTINLFGHGYIKDVGLPLDALNYYALELYE